MIRLVLSVILIATLVGCAATGQIGNLPHIAADELSSKLVLIRVNSIVGAANNFYVTLDGKVILSIGSGEYAEFPISTGVHFISVYCFGGWSPTWKEDAKQFYASPNQTYHFEISPSLSCAKIISISQEKARKGLENSTLIMSGKKYSDASLPAPPAREGEPFQPIPGKYTYQEPGWFEDKEKTLREQLHNTKGILSDTNGVWRPSTCMCGPCDVWIWSEGNTFYTDFTKTGNPNASGTVTMVRNIGLYQPENEGKDYQTKSYKIIQKSGDKFTLTTLYDRDKHEITILHFQFELDGSEYAFYKCEDF